MSTSGDDLSAAADDLEIIEEPVLTEPIDQDQGNEETNETNENQENEETKETEVKVKRVRNPQPKLNAERLKGPRGLLMLEDIFKNVKFKGHGYEEEDLGVLMKNYEYWCHRLFPKFPFDDCLEKIDRLGTKREVQTYLKRIRMDLIFDEPTVNNREDDDSDVDVERNIDNTQNDIFDNLLSQVPQQSNATTSDGLTDEQLDRIKINRERAQRLRQQMLIRVREKNKDLLNNSNSQTNVEAFDIQPEGSSTLSQSSGFSAVMERLDITENALANKPLTPEITSIGFGLSASQTLTDHTSAVLVEQTGTAVEAQPDDSQTSPETNSRQTFSDNMSVTSGDEQISHQTSITNTPSNLEIHPNCARNTPESHKITENSDLEPFEASESQESLDAQEAVDTVNSYEGTTETMSPKGNTEKTKIDINNLETAVSMEVDI